LPHRPVKPIQRGNAKRLRAEMTEPEMRLWQKLKAHRLQGLSFRRQVPIGPYIKDFLCSRHGLIVELDGSGHGEPAQQGHDARRDAWLASQDYRVLRIENIEVLRNLAGVLDNILFHCGQMEAATGGLTHDRSAA
jgi:very-short-patch-repair endonuclease